MWGTYFAPMMEATQVDGALFRMPDVARLASETTLHWEQRAKETANPLMQARYADCIWDLDRKLSSRKRQVDFARLAIAAYLKAVDERLYKHVVDGMRWLERALNLSMTLKDSASILQAVSAIFSFYDVASGVDSPAVWWMPFDLLCGKKGLTSPEQEAKIISDLEAVLALTSSTESGAGFSPFNAKEAAERLSQHYKTSANTQRLVSCYGKAFEEIAMNADPMLALAWLQPVIERYEQVGLKMEAESLVLISEEKGKSIGESLKSYTVESSIDLSGLNLTLTGLIENEDAASNLHWIAVTFLPDIEFAKSLLNEMKTAAPLQSLIGITKIRLDGQPAAQIGALDEDQEGRLQTQVSDNVKFMRPLLSHSLSRVFTEKCINADAVIAVLYQSPVLPITRSRFCWKDFRHILTEIM